MPKTYCPDCDTEFNIAKPRLGAAVKCPDCDTELEVISVTPLEVDYPLGSLGDDDWDDEDDDDY
jgi:lysine biosynthesis protein LysW